MTKQKYQFINGWTAQREGRQKQNVLLPWILRDENGKKIDQGKYRHELFKKYNLEEIPEVVV